MDETEKITIDIPKKILQKLEASFGKDAPCKIAFAAFKEWVDWFEAIQRYMSIPDLEAHRVLTLYEEMLTEDVPSPVHLSSTLNLIPSRGRYIAHSISYQHPRWWRKRLLIVAIRDFQNNSLSPRSKNSTSDFRITTDIACRLVVDQALQQVTETEDIAAIQGKRSGGALYYDLPDRHRLKVIEALKDILNENSENGV